MSTEMPYSKSEKEKNSADIVLEALIKLNATILQWKKKSLKL